MSQGGHFEMQVVPASPECGNIKPGSNCSHSVGAAWVKRQLFRSFET